MFCEFCGNEIDDRSDFCPVCGMALKKESFSSKFQGMTDKVTDKFKQPLNNIPTMTPPRPAVNPVAKTAPASSTVLAEGEVIVKRYNCANVKGAKGYLTVTNKRMMFNASGGTSRYDQEVTLSSVSGFTCYKGTNFDLKLIIIGAVIAIMGISILATSGNSFFGGSGLMMTGLFVAVIGGFIIFLGIKQAFLISVYAKDVSLSPIVVGEGPKSLLGNSALYAIASSPTSDTDIMLNELGALVQDLQSMGDLAIEKWQNRVSARDLPTL